MTPFARALLNWYAAHGRKDLPWQRDRDPYRIWVSEVMLQQTQVATVIPYYERFITRFPSIAALAAAAEDTVLQHWTGLGYYARARNLHRAARLVVSQHGGVFPRELAAVQALPGIGESTAGAILAFAFDAPHAILDGNVKRVLARHFAVAGAPQTPAVLRRLWALAREHTPIDHTARYNQAIMDLGAMICTRAPQCQRCPVAESCGALAQNAVRDYPAPRARRALPIRQVRMLLVQDASGAVLLHRRTASGIWGGLWSFPECAPEIDPAAFASTTLGLNLSLEPSWPPLRHTFTHFHLDILPQPARVIGATGVREPLPSAMWYKLSQSLHGGVPAPVLNLLDRLRKCGEQPLS